MEYKWLVSVWGISHFLVESMDDLSATVLSEYVPIAGGGEPRLDCKSRMRFELRPFRLVNVQVTGQHGTLEYSEGHGPDEMASSPCVLVVPRHPTTSFTSVAQAPTGQHVALDGDSTVFTLQLNVPERWPPSEPRRRIWWRAGDVWWHKQETVDGEGRSLFGQHNRSWRGRVGHSAHVERARLIAVDGVPVRPTPWSAPAPDSRIKKASHHKDDPDGLGPNGLLDEDP